jgi:hypothetical protein
MNAIKSSSIPSPCVISLVSQLRQEAKGETRGLPVLTDVQRRAGRKIGDQKQTRVPRI